MYWWEEFSLKRVALFKRIAQLVRYMPTEAANVLKHRVLQSSNSTADTYVDVLVSDVR